MIYFIKSESGHVKIGYTNNGIDGRIASLQTGCPFELTLLTSIDGSIYQEKALHRRFRKYQVRLEWFVLSGEIEEFIKNPILIKDKPEECLSDEIRNDPPSEPIKYRRKQTIRYPKSTSGLYESIFKDNIPAVDEIKLLRVLNTLQPLESGIIKSRYGIGCEQKTLQAIGNKHGVCRERIRQIESKALRKLKHPSRRRHLYS